MSIDLTEEEGLEAGELVARALPLAGLLYHQFTEEEIALMERSINAVEEAMGPRQVLADLFGRSAFNQAEQNRKANIPVIRAIIALWWEADKVKERSTLTRFGDSTFGDGVV